MTPICAGSLHAGLEIHSTGDLGQQTGLQQSCVFFFKQERLFLPQYVILLLFVPLRTYTYIHRTLFHVNECGLTYGFII
jgi:hypothetical protein